MPETGLLMPETGRAQTRRVEKALRYWQQDLPSAIVPPKS
jgi:hypothetical protein